MPQSESDWGRLLPEIGHPQQAIACTLLRVGLERGVLVSPLASPRPLALLGASGVDTNGARFGHVNGQGVGLYSNLTTY